MLGYISQAKAVPESIASTHQSEKQLPVHIREELRVLRRNP